MYLILLALHSLIRWFVLISLIFAIFRAYSGWFSKREFSRLDNSIRNLAVTTAHTQFLLGIALYFVSPVVSYFLHNFGTAVHMREIRFFGMEHVTVMFVAIAIITIGSSKAKRKVTGQEKFKTMAIWFTIGLILILSSIPWTFSPLISRPYFRPF